MSEDESPLDSFLPAPNSGLVAWFTDWGHRDTRVPIVGYFTRYGPDEPDGSLLPDVEPAVMDRNGWVANLQDFADGSGYLLIGVYPEAVKPDDVDAQHARETRARASAAGRQAAEK
jgi:hypothetical protein